MLERHRLGAVDGRDLRRRPACGDGECRYRHLAGERRAGHRYDQRVSYTLVVRATDAVGNRTTTTVAFSIG